MPDRNPMKPLDSLFALVMANPDDDAARVVYGDALAQAGDPRGELITSQCALAAMGIDTVDDLIDADVDDAELARLAETARHVNRLVARVGRPWCAAIRRDAELESIEFRRGFPEIFDLSGSNAVAVLRRASVQTPVRTVRIRDVYSNDLARLAGLELPHLRSLELDCHLRSASELWERVLARPSLRRLVLEGRVENMEPSWFARLPELEELSIVEPRHHPLERRDELHEALPRYFPARATSPSRIVLDGLYKFDFESAGSVRTLELRGAIRPSLFAAVLEAAINVESLVYDPVVDDTDAVDAGVQLIAQSQAPLRRIRLHGVTGRSVAMLARAPERRGLRALHVSTRGLEAEDDLAASILALPQLVQLGGLSSWRVVLDAEHPTLVDFWSPASDRDTLRALRAHFGAVIPWFIDVSPRKHRDARHVALPASSQLDVKSLRAILQGIEELIVPLRRAGILLVVDPLLDNEGISVKLDSESSLIRLACRPEELGELAERLDQVVEVLVRATGGAVVL